MDEDNLHFVDISVSNLSLFQGNQRSFSSPLLVYSAFSSQPSFSQLQLTSFNFIQLHSTSFNFSQLQSTSVNFIQLHSTSVNFSQLQSTSFNFIQLQSTSVNFSQLQSTSVNFSQLYRSLVSMLPCCFIFQDRLVRFPSHTMDSYSNNA